MMTLDNLRSKIDQIDSKLLELISQRLKLVKEIGILKKQSDKKIQNRNREKEILNIVLLNAAHLDLDGKMIAKIWKIIIEQSKLIQNKYL
ncbi:hypothetical protein A2960_02085 [Candidatus Gottesmanbacteria bacterium RIFCSPLOWO2_01_FULL_39_12b]|uniref:Chorismate mutase domain-containing protein n=1 Tax=Candidatus Gottesmanbacteria bacterium RIFCSPLOWO2_01_FULL_39_12b TaxID=1798388 RepID=A0A1F6AQE6_9BACT|nr:MAG: hypothetical protein A2960_02085 [Candidatus Gottesmanbacteria bacterium RIFCSPLOWO2_01_FULL_39_12b]